MMGVFDCVYWLRVFVLVLFRDKAARAKHQLISLTMLNEELTEGIING